MLGSNFLCSALFHSDLIYPWLVHSALVSFMVLLVGSVAVLLCRQPTRRARIIELSLIGCLVAPWLGLIPGYPQLPVVRWSAALLQRHESAPFSIEQPTQRMSERLAQHVAEQPTAQQKADKVVLESSPSPLPVRRMASTTTLETANASAKTLNPAAWIVALYVLGVSLGAAWWLVGIIGLARIVWTSRPAPPHCRELLGQIAGRAGDRVRLILSPHVSQPLASAWGRPVIVLPENLSDDGQSLRWCLAHEWTHVERHDFRVWLMAGLVRALFFYHPLVWWMRRQLRLCQDYVADARAARHASQPEDYAEFLTVRAAAGSLHPAIVGLGMGFRKSELYRRIVMLVENQPIESRAPRLWSVTVTLTALILVAVAAALLNAPKAAAEGQPAATPQSSPAKSESKSSSTDTTDTTTTNAADPFGDGTTANAADPFTVKLPDGITVELLGLAENPSKDKPWWRPDGSPLAERPYETLKAVVHSEKGDVTREIAVVLHNLPSEPVDVQLLSDPWYHSAGGGLNRSVKDGAKLEATAMSVPNKGTVTVRVGVAAGAWKTVKESARGDEASGESNLGVAFSHVYEKEGDVFVAVGHNINGPETRVIAVDKDGREHSASLHSSGGANGFHLLSCMFSKLTLNDIKVFRLQSRPHLWVEFLNVSLHPGCKTSVGSLIDLSEVQAYSAQYAPSRPAVSSIESEHVKRIKKALLSPTEMDFSKTPLQDVVDYLKDYHGIEIELDIKALSDAGLRPDTPITKRLKGISLRSALRLLLKEHNLTYVIQDEVLLITTVDQAEEHLETIVYPVTDLVLPPNPTAETEPDYDSLIELIKTAVKPTSWDDTGSVGSIVPFDNSLSIVVSQTLEQHEEIERLLEKLRAVNREQAKEKQPPFKRQSLVPKPKPKTAEEKSSKPDQSAKPSP